MIGLVKEVGWGGRAESKNNAGPLAFGLHPSVIRWVDSRNSGQKIFCVERIQAGHVAVVK
jgi:hypothetical protein